MRDDYINDLLISKLGNDCTWMSEDKDAQDIGLLKEFYDVENSTFVDCPDFQYIITLLPSEEMYYLTNITIFRYNKLVPNPSVKNDLQSITRVGKLINNFMQNTITDLCRNRTVRLCLNVNIFPNVQVFFFRHFPAIKASTDQELNEYQYMNLISSNIIRVCVNAQMNFLNYMKILETIDEKLFQELTPKFSQLLINCVGSYYKSMEYFAEQNKLPNKYDDETQILQVISDGSTVDQTEEDEFLFPCA